MADRLQTLEVISYHRLFEQYQPPSELFDAAGKAEAVFAGKSLIPITILHGISTTLGFIDALLSLQSRLLVT